jgi:hypothetical protein
LLGLGGTQAVGALEAAALDLLVKDVSFPADPDRMIAQAGPERLLEKEDRLKVMGCSP